jgi:hypothetical protein
VDFFTCRDTCATHCVNVLEQTVKDLLTQQFVNRYHHLVPTRQLQAFPLEHDSSRISQWNPFLNLRTRISLPCQSFSIGAASRPQDEDQKPLPECSTHIKTSLLLTWVVGS